MEGDVNLEQPNGTTDYEPPCDGNKTLRDPNSLSCTGTDQTDPEMLLKAVRYHSVPVGSLHFTLLTEVELAGAQYINSLEGSGRNCKLRDVARHRRTQLQC